MHKFTKTEVCELMVSFLKTHIHITYINGQKNIIPLYLITKKTLSVYTSTNQPIQERGNMKQFNQFKREAAGNNMMAGGKIVQFDEFTGLFNEFNQFLRWS